MNIAKKFAAGAVAISTAATLSGVAAFVPVAGAQTVADLQAQIDALLSQLAALQGGSSTTTTGGACDATLSGSADMTIGSKGAGVTALQNYLTGTGHFTFSGGATGYFGAVTQSALAAWQAANGVSPASGYWGPISRSAYSAACGSTTTTTSGGSSTPGGSDLSGEASLDKFETDSASDDEIEEGAKDAEIAEVTIEFNDGDGEISRIDLALEGTGDEQDPWDVFEDISLWIDGEKIAEENADDKDDYLDEDAGTLRISGLSIVGEEDKDVEITVAATLQDNLDGVNDGEAWTVEFDALRYFDADGVATTDTTTGDLGDATGESFTIEAEGANDEIIVKTSSDDVDSTTLQVEDDKKSDWYSVFLFDLDTDDSENDITFDNIFVSVTVSSSTYDGIVDDAELIVGGVTIDDVTVTGGATATGVLDFDVDGDVTIDAGDREEAELRLRFKSLATGDEGTTVMGSVTAANRNAIDAEGADDVTDLSGTATGDAHTLRTAGISTVLTDDSAVVTESDGATNDYATFELEVEVEAFEQDVFISTTPGTSISYSLVDGAGATAATGTQTVTLSSTADENGGYFELNEGDKETFTLDVTYTPGVAGTAARLLLNSISFAATAVAPTDTQTTLPATDYRTDVVTIVN